MEADVLFAVIPEAYDFSKKHIIAVWWMQPHIGEEILQTVTWLIWLYIENVSDDCGGQWKC